MPLAKAGKAGGRWGQPSIRKPGDLPARRKKPADGVFRDRVKAEMPLLAHAPLPLEGCNGHDPLRLHNLQGR